MLHRGRDFGLNLADETWIWSRAELIAAKQFIVDSGCVRMTHKSENIIFQFLLLYKAAPIRTPSWALKIKNGTHGMHTTHPT
jgi:hypothetical protein